MEIIIFDWAAKYCNMELKGRTTSNLLASYKRIDICAFVCLKQCMNKEDYIQRGS